MCSVTAYEKWKADKTVKPSPNLPVFRRRDGTAYTGREFNRDLQRLLGEEATNLGGTITSHSFRSGLATAMAKAGYTDEEIMAIGVSFHGWYRLCDCTVCLIAVMSLSFWY